MGQSKTTNTATPTGPGVDYFANVVNPAAENLANSPFDAYTGSFAPGLSDYTTKAGGIYDQIGAAGSRTPEDWNALTQQNMSAYTQNVMDPTMALMNRERQKQLVGEQANIIGSGAFDSSRRGVYEGESSAAYGLGRDKMIADLNRQGYNEAQAATMNQFNAQQGALGASAAGLGGIGSADTNLRLAEMAGQYGEFNRAYEDPFKRFGSLVGGAGAAPVGSVNTETYKPGLFEYMSAAATAAATAAASDPRLKTNVTPRGEVGGIKLYDWDWNDEGKRIADPAQPTFGVMADELQSTHPHLVKRGDDGYLRVNYVGLIAEMEAA